MEQVLAEGRIPSISLCVRVDGGEVFHATLGAARKVPFRPALEDQAYDLASVTKALAGTAVIASLVDEGRFDLDTAVARWFPEADGAMTVRHLLQHTSGMPAWRPFFARVAGAWGTAAAREEVLSDVRATPLEAPPGTRHVYSDLGFLTLLAIAERETGRPFDALFLDRVLEPSGVKDLRWGWPTAAATELCPIRETLVEGTVHDLNCASIGGVSAHAGLFGTSRAVATLAERLMDGLVPSITRFWAEKGPGTHTCGWDTVSTEGYTATGRFFPSDARGHSGYTGTSVWVVPSRRTSIALLTNRVHPNDEKEAIREARPRIHDAVAQALGWDTFSR
jgi:CubicO group peptidase (beta-lactamase class C family)